MGTDASNQNRFCVSCGSQLDEGARFCANCGAAVSTPEPEAAAETQVLPNAAYGMPGKTQEMPATTTATAPDQTDVTGTQPMPVQQASEKGTNGYAIFLIVGIVVLVIAIAIGIFLFVSGKSSPSPTVGNTPATSSTQDAGQSATTNADYMLPDSSTRLYSQSELEALGTRELFLARNEVYAKHGRIFTRDELTQYFNTKSWYKPSISPDQFNDESILNDIERQNVRAMLEIEQARNSPYLQK